MDLRSWASARPRSLSSKASSLSPRWLSQSANEQAGRSGVANGASTDPSGVLGSFKEEQMGIRLDNGKTEMDRLNRRKQMGVRLNKAFATLAGAVLLGALA